MYQAWLAREQLPNNASVRLDPTGDLLLRSWSQGGLTYLDSRLTCRRPPTALDPASNATLVSISSDVDLYNAVALAHTYPNASNPVLLLQNSVTLTSPLWTAQAITLQRSATLSTPAAHLRFISGVSALPLLASSRADASPAPVQGDAPSNTTTTALAPAASPASGANGTTSTTTTVDGVGVVVLDVADLVAVLGLSQGVVLTARGITWANVPMVAGYAPVPFTGLGMVSSFLWTVGFTRTLLPRWGEEQLVLEDCDIIVYQEELDHMSLWTTVMTSTAGPIASLVDAYRIGIRNITANLTLGPVLRYSRLEAYGFDYVNVALVPPTLYDQPYNLTARRAYVPLWQLNTPLNTTVVPVWTQADLQGGLGAASRLPACSPFSNITIYFHLFTNLSLDVTKWPAEGFNLPCNVTIAGTPSFPGGTWLNFNLLSKFLNLGKGAVLTLRSLTLINMRSSQGTYSLSSLQQTTLPLWPVSRPAPGPAAPPQLWLSDAAVALPPEEFRSFAAVLGFRGRLPSQAINGSIQSVELEDPRLSTTPQTTIAVKSLIGLNNMNCSGVTFFDAAAAAAAASAAGKQLPFAAMLGPNIYGTADIADPPPPAPPEAPPPSSGLSTSAVVAIAVAVPAGGVAVIVVLVVLLLHRRSRVSGRGLQQVKGTSSELSSGEGKEGEGEEAGKEQEGPAQAGGGKGGPRGGRGDKYRERDTSSFSNAIMAEGDVEGGGEAEGEGDGEEELGPRPLQLELHQLVLDFAREIEDKHLTIHGAVGSGGFATVYRGVWRGIDVAVKVIEFKDRTVAGSEKLQVRAMTEAAIAANIQHRNIVTTYSYDIRPVHPGEPAGAGMVGAGQSALLGIGPAAGAAAAGGQQPGGGGGRRASNRASRSNSQDGSSQAAVQTWKLCLIQEFCELGSVRQALESRLFHTGDGQPIMPTILRLLLDVVRGLQHLHSKNIVHGDLTPSNILLRVDPAVTASALGLGLVLGPGAGGLSGPGVPEGGAAVETVGVERLLAACGTTTDVGYGELGGHVSHACMYVAKLADFGLSVKMDPSQESVDNDRTGTPFYASPEVRQHGNLTKASDLFALGVIMWELWHGRPCYQRVRGVRHYIHATGYPSFPPVCPPPYAQLASACMRRSLSERPQLIHVHESLHAMAAMLGGGGSGGPGSCASRSTGSSACSHSHVAVEVGGGGGVGVGAGAGRGASEAEVDVATLIQQQKQALAMQGQQQQQALQQQKRQQQQQPPQQQAALLHYRQAPAAVPAEVPAPPPQQQQQQRPLVQQLAADGSARAGIGPWAANTSPRRLPPHGADHAVAAAAALPGRAASDAATEGGRGGGRGTVSPLEVLLQVGQGQAGGAGGNGGVRGAQLDPGVVTPVVGLVVDQA